MFPLNICVFSLQCQLRTSLVTMARSRFEAVGPSRNMLLPSFPHCLTSQHTGNGLVMEAADWKGRRVVRLREMRISLNFQRWCLGDNLASCVLSAGSEDPLNANRVLRRCCQQWVSLMLDHSHCSIVIYPSVLLGLVHKLTNAVLPWLPGRRF